jgi:hypothetical protein
MRGIGMLGDGCSALTADWQAHERASATAERLHRHVREMTERLDRMPYQYERNLLARL